MAPLGEQPGDAWLIDEYLRVLVADEYGEHFVNPAGTCPAVAASLRQLLREVMLKSGTSRSELSRLSGVWQSSISQFLTGKVQLSHDQLDRLMSCMGRSSLEQWRPVIERNLQRLRDTVRGQPHLRNLDRWESLLDHGDVPGLQRTLTGLDRDSVEMREVSPVGGLLPDDERLEVLRMAG